MKRIFALTFFLALLSAFLARPAVAQTTVKGGDMVIGSNSSTTALAGGAAFTGTAFTPQGNASIVVDVLADVDSAASGLLVQQGPDGTNWDFQDAFSYTSANTGKAFIVGVRAPYARVKYTNGASAQATFRLKTSVQVFAEPLPRTLTAQGNLKVSIEENSAASGGSASQVQGTAADGANAAGNPVLIAVREASGNVQTALGDSNGVPQVALANGITTGDNMTIATAATVVAVLAIHDGGSNTFDRVGLGAAALPVQGTSANGADANATENPLLIAGAEASGNVRRALTDGAGAFQVGVAGSISTGDNMTIATAPTVVAILAAYDGGTNTFDRVTNGAGTVATALRTTLGSDDPAVTALQILDDWDETDRAKVNLIASQAGITGGAGAVAANTPRATLASDDPAVVALQVIDDWDETDRAKVNLIAGQVAITGGAGAVAANTPRATLASDDPAVVALQVIDDWDESDRAKVNLIAGQAGIAGGTGVDGATVPRVTLATNVGLPAGTNNVGDFDIASWVGGSTAPTVGQKTSANSIPVVLPSDYTLSAGTVSRTATYRATAVAQTPAASATDVFMITGSAGKTIKVRKLQFSMTATAGAVADLLLIRRSTKDTVGTAATRVQMDTNDSASFCDRVDYYTANPTVGTLVGNVAAVKYFIQSSTPNGNWIQTENFGITESQPVTLRGEAQCLCVNLNGVSYGGGSFSVTCEWTEE